MFILADKDLEVKEIKKGTGEILSDVRINKKRLANGKSNHGNHTRV